MQNELENKMQNELEVDCIMGEIFEDVRCEREGERDQRR